MNAYAFKEAVTATRLFLLPHNISETAGVPVALLALVITLGSPIRSRAAAVADAANTEAPAVVEAGAHHRIWSNGSGTVTELADNLNYFDGTSWKPSEETIQVLADGSAAVAEKGQLQARWAANLNSAGAIQFGVGAAVFQSHLSALVYYDTALQQSIILAVPKDSIAQLPLGNTATVIYPDALDGASCDVEYNYRRGSFSQDVVILRQLQPPEAFNFSSKSTRIQIWTEFIAAPALTVQKKAARLDPQNGAAPQAAAAELPDEVLSFGPISFGRGKAFKIDDRVAQQIGANPSDSTVDVGKEWVVLENRNFLVETLAYSAAEPILKALPPAVALNRAAANGNVAAMARRSAGSRRQLAALLPRPPEPRAAQPVRVKQLAQARTSRGPALLWDYTTLNTASYTDYTFKSDSTFFITGILTLGGVTTFESACIKFTNYNASAPAQINITGSGARVVCRNSSYRPTIFCAKDDNSVGGIISNSSGSPSGWYANFALSFDYYSSGVLANLSNVRIRNAYRALSFVGGAGHVLLHGQIINCYNAALLSYTDVSLRNCLIYGIYDKVFDGSYSPNGATKARNENVTISQCGNLGPMYFGGYPTYVYMTNCLLSSITSGSIYYYGQNNQIVPTGFAAFTNLGSASHYLADDTYRGLGTDAIDLQLLGDLRTRTTYPPVVISSDFTAPTVLAPEVPRNTGPIDLGYHYECADFAWTGRNLSSSLVLTNGVAVMIYGAAGTTLASGSQFISEGTPKGFNHLFRYSSIQEMPSVWGGTNATMSLFNFTTSASTLPELRMRFTDIVLLGDTNSRARIFDAGSDSLMGIVALKDCQVHGGSISLAPNSDNRQMTLALTNNLFERSFIKLTQSTKPFAVYCWNNLFGGGTFAGVAGTTPVVAWAAYDNLFDGTSLAGSSGIANGFNGYLGVSAMSGTSGSDKFPASRDFVTGPLGTNYYPTSGGNLSLLIAAGSRTPAAASLYHHTVKASGTKAGSESGNISIGYHYIATVNGQPADSETGGGDGLADYFENRAGDGGTSDPSSWTLANTDSDDASDFIEFLEGRNPGVYGTAADSTGTFVALEVYTPNR